MEEHEATMLNSQGAIGGAGEGTTIAVFDLDGTLLDGDSTGRWMTGLMTRSWLRASSAILAAPFAASMLFFPQLRKRGASIFLWIATAGMDEAALQRSVDDFAQRFQERQAKLSFRPGAIEALEKHLAEGHQVAVVTAAPSVLAKALLGRWSPRITVLGSSLKQVAGGWVGGRHCRGPEKCRVLEENGYPSKWHFAYSDSDDDHPLLERAERAFLVNASNKVAFALRKRGMEAFERLEW